MRATKRMPNCVINPRATMKVPMKTLLAVLSLSGVLSIQPGAQAFAGSFDGAMLSVQYGGGGPGAGKGANGRPPFREAGNAQPAPQPPRERPRGQLTDDERRQLHRDLDKANRELYSGNRRRTVPAD